ncbi:extracellular solute-binding protein [Paenibacillus wenxiniae]|uniref:Extracellular solute-binding protein n=1 Tax=Paenibacillus wenxiniae TaxID=1636843 RepID=A0ABW4RLK8_9BACL
MKAMSFTHTFRLLLSMVTLFIPITLTTACSTPSDATATTSSTAVSTHTAGEQTALDMKSILAQKPSGQQIVVATNNTGNGRDQWLADAAKQAGFNIKLVGLGGGDLTSRVIGEVNNPTLNVVWGPSDTMFQSMSDAHALQKWTPSWADQLTSHNEQNGYSWSYELQPKLLIANPKLYTATTAPTSYQDLWQNPQFHGKYAVPTDFGGTTNRAIIGGIIAQYLDPKGELGVSQAGWDAIKSYFQYGYQTPKGEKDMQNLVDGKVPITYIYASGLKSFIDTYHMEPLIVYSRTGEPTNTNQLGVVKNNNPAVVEESIRFANWLGSADMMGDYASTYGSIVVNRQAQSHIDPFMQKVMKTSKPQQADWNYINSMMDQWVAKIQLEYMK